METLKNFLISVIIILLSASVCIAEEWYQAMERSSNDYRGSVGTMISDVDGAKYTPRYTSAELQSTRAMADSRQLMQSAVAVSRVAQVSGSSVTASGGAIPGALGPSSGTVTPPKVGGAGGTPGGGLLGPPPSQ